VAGTDPAPRILDFHCDTVLRVLDAGVDLAQRLEDGHLDLPRLRDSGVGCQVFACFASRIEHGDGVVARADRLLDAAQELGRLPGVVIPQSSAALEALRRDPDHTGVMLAVEGGDALGGDLARLELFRRRGVRYLTVAWGDNELTGSAFGDGSGLTPLGRDAIREMHDLGILVDVSHMSDAAIDDTLETASGVVIASHSNTRARCASPRNLTDDHIRAIAERGGVIGVLFAPGFLSEQTRVAEAPLMERALALAEEDPRGILGAMERLKPQLDRVPLPSSDSVVEHIEHLVEVGGVECAAFGSDFDGIPYTPTDIPDCTGFGTILDKLRARGLSDTELEALCWGNWARVLGPVLDG
jgi:membrane dipeptidase